jgi:diguanylate cyclase (GGDEF)-like protein/PAS domain S-box-containing protein
MTLENSMASTSNSAERWGDPVVRSAAAANEHLVARHLLFSLSVLLFYFLLARPEIILVSPDLGFTAWFPATGLVLAVMLCISPRYLPLLVLADALAGATIYHQRWLSWSETVAPIAAASSYAAAAYILRGPLKIDPTLRHRRDVVRYVSVTMVAALPATFAGVLSLVGDHTIPSTQFWSSAAQWYMGDAVGLVGFAPFLLIHVFPLVKPQLSTLREETPQRMQVRGEPQRQVREILEAAGQGGAILLVLWIMFGRTFGSKEFYFLSFVPIIWVAMRHGIKRVATALLFLNFGMVLALRLFPAPADFQIKVGLLMLAVSATGLIVGSEVSERQRVTRQLSERTGFLNSLIEHNPLAIAVQDHEGRVRFCNDAFTELFLYQREEVVGRVLDPLICSPKGEGTGGPEGTPRLGHSNQKVVRRIRKDGKALDLELHEVAIDLGSWRSASYAIYRDISEQVKSAMEAEEYADSLAKLVTELQLRTMQMSLLNDMGDLLQCCGNTEEAFAVVGQSARKVLSVSTAGVLFVFKPNREALLAAASWGPSFASDLEFPPADCWALRRGQAYWSEYPREGVICAHLKNPVAASYLCVPVMANGETLGIVHVQYNRSESAKGTEAFESLQQSQQRLAVAVSGQVGLSLASLRLRETLREQSIRDPLTGLFNRRFMEESLDRELLGAARKRRSLAVVFLDLDHFKAFNDTFGHEAGDDILRTMAEALRTHYRGDDIICRYGGEEFAIILPESTAKEAAKRTEDLREAVKKLKIRRDGKVLNTITISAGIAAFPEHAADGGELLRMADSGLYQSKSDGRDRITVAAHRS